MEKFNYILLENDSVTSINRTFMQSYKSSLSNNSINVNNEILNDVWEDHMKLQIEPLSESVCVNVNSLLLNLPTDDIGNWSSSLDTFTRPEDLFNVTINPYKCTSESIDTVEIKSFLKSSCSCNLGTELNLSSIKPVEWNDRKTSILAKTLSSDGSSQERSGDAEKIHFKPQFGRSSQIFKPFQPSVSKTSSNNMREISCKDNEELKFPQTKISFKTAKETLLATNPAAKKTLGASRKAQAKFISPMIGAQEKQEDTEPPVSDDRLKNLDAKMVELIESEIIDKGTPIGWDDIAGLHMAKSVIQEAVVYPLLRPDIFTGLRRPPKGILLFGPPGTGKTLIGKCVAAQCKATFFSISASSLTSKWIGDGEKMVRALFAVARSRQPAVIFIDEIDSLLTQRSDSEHESTRRIKTEFLVQFDGAATAEEDRLLIVGATNRPQELDEAARRRLVKRLYIPLPDVEARQQIITNLLRTENNDLVPQEIQEIAEMTEGYSGADMKSLCSEAAMGPIRSVPLSQIVTIDRNKVRPVSIEDFKNALQRVRPSVSQDDLGQYVKWNKTFGQGF